MKRFPVILLALALCLAVYAPALAAPVPVQYVDGLAVADAVDEQGAALLRWSEVRSVAHGASISSSGSATVSSKVNCYTSTTKITMTVYLQKLSGSSFSNHKTYTGSGTGSASVSKAVAVERGTYRVHTVATIKDSAGNLIETIDLYSDTTTY